MKTAEQWQIEFSGTPITAVELFKQIQRDALRAAAEAAEDDPDDDVLVGGSWRAADRIRKLLP